MRLATKEEMDVWRSRSVGSALARREGRSVTLRAADLL
jgi:hypothetical protein